MDTDTRTDGRVLVIGDDNRSVLAVIRSLGRAGKEVHVAPFDWHAPALRSRFVAAVHRLPRHADAPDAWATALREVVDATHFDLIVPCCDRGILLLRRYADRFADQRIASPAPDGTADILLDKAMTRAAAAAADVPVAPGRELRADDTAAGLAAEFGFPLFVKPRRSYSLEKLGRRSAVRRANDLAGLQAILAGVTAPEGWLVEGAVPGTGVGYSVLARDGVISQAFQHRRLREAETGGSSLRESEALDPEMGAAVERLVAMLRLSGVCMFEFRRAEDGKFVLLEANPRFWGSLPLPVSIGVDFPLYLYDQMVLNRIHPQASYPAGVRARNFLQDGRNLALGLKSPETLKSPEAISDAVALLAHPLRAMLKLEKSDTLVFDDLLPGLVEIPGALPAARNKRRLGRADFKDRRRKAGPAEGSGG